MIHFTIVMIIEIYNPDSVRSTVKVKQFKVAVRSFRVV